MVLKNFQYSKIHTFISATIQAISKNKMNVTITPLHNEHECFSLDESGFSLLIETPTHKILFDFGVQNEALTSLEEKNISINEIDYFVLSHGHIDHLEAIKRINSEKKKKLFAHPKAILPKFYENNPIGFDPQSLKALENFSLELSTHTVEVCSGVHFLGEIPRVFEFEKSCVGNTCFGEDNIEDDSGLAIETEEGIVLISGCAHSGICNMIQYTETLFNKNVCAIYGGFHLLEEKRTNKTVDYLKAKNPQIFFGHCVNDFSKNKLSLIGGQHFKTGESTSWQ